MCIRDRQCDGGAGEWRRDEETPPGFHKGGQPGRGGGHKCHGENSADGGNEHHNGGHNQHKNDALRTRSGKTNRLKTRLVKSVKDEFSPLRGGNSNGDKKDNCRSYHIRRLHVEDGAGKETLNAQG